MEAGKAPSAKDAKAKGDNFSFPDGGWVCARCQNYNFQGRKDCNRCSKKKDDTDFNGKPKHLIKKNKKEAKKADSDKDSAPTPKQEVATAESKLKTIEQAVKDVSIEPKVTGALSLPAGAQGDCPAASAAEPSVDVSKKQLTERVGDWLCLNCDNLNFGFRDLCNRCDMHRLQVGKTFVGSQEQVAPAPPSSAQGPFFCP